MISSELGLRLGGRNGKTAGRRLHFYRLIHWQRHKIIIAYDRYLRCDVTGRRPEKYRFTNLPL